MIYNEQYDIDVKINDSPLDVSPLELSFDIHDSIYSFFNNAIIKIRDVTGMMREYLVPTEGNKITIRFGDLNKVSVCNYTIVNEECDKLLTVGVLNGVMTVKLANQYYDFQECMSTAYKDIISSIVRKVISNFSFTASNIESTVGSTTWYRLFTTQKDFIQETLIPNAFSSTASKTPFYCFISNDNTFNFTSHKKMMDSVPVADLVYKTTYMDEFSVNSVLDIKPFKTGSEKTKHLRNRLVLSRSTSTGEYIKQTSLIINYPENKESGLSIPINSLNKEVRGIKDASFKYTKTGEKESYEARIINDEKDGMSIERFIVTTPFNPLLQSGKTINLTTYYMSESDNPPSLYTSGKYLIEDCTHSWNTGDNNRGLTTIIIGRKFVKVPSKYNFGKNFLKAQNGNNKSS